MKNPGLEWWTELAVNILDGKPLSFAKTLSKLPKLLKRDEPEEKQDPLAKELLNHTNYILERVHGPLPIDQDLNLWDMYVTPKANYWENGKEIDEEPEIFVDLLDGLRAQVQKSTHPIIVHGQPGHGKSSSMRMLTQVLALDPNSPIDSLLFYEFKNLGKLDGEFYGTLRRETPFVTDESFFHGRQSLMIFDGLDERQVSDGMDRDLGNFIRDIFLLAKRVNKREDSRLNVLITGRTLFVAQTKRHIKEAYHCIEIQDFEANAIEHWLSKYNQIKKLKEPLLLAELKQRHLGELISQPILLSFIATILSNDLGKKMLEEAGDDISRRKIYQTIVSWTYHRKHQDEQGISSLPDKKTYTRFLKMVAFVIFHSGKENILLKGLVRELKSKENYFELEEIFHNRNMTDTIKDMAVGFYFEGINDGCFSFIHKSIADFLAMEALFVLLNEAMERFNPEKPAKSAKKVAKDMYFLLGKMEISREDHRPYILNIKNEEKNSELYEKLRLFLEESRDHSLLIDHEGHQNNDPLVSEGNLLDGLMLWGHVPGASYKALPIRFLNYMGRTDFNLPEAQLEGSDFENCNFVFSNLNGVNLNEAILNGASLHEASLHGASLQEAGLTGISLDDASLDRASFNDAYLDGASLDRASLHGTSLHGASLQGADLEDASLGDASLEGANLDHAYLVGADLHNATLDNANLSRADLDNIRNYKSIKSIQGANIQDIENAPEGFREWALEHGAVEEEWSQEEDFF